MRLHELFSRAARTTGASVIVTLAIPFGLAACAGSTADSGQTYEEDLIIHPVTEADKAAVKSEAPLAADSATLWVNGLGCPLCASNLDVQLMRIEGVASVVVDLSDGTAALTFVPGADRPSPARLGHAVEDAGFTLVKVQASAQSVNGGAR